MINSVQTATKVGYGSSPYWSLHSDLELSSHDRSGLSVNAGIQEAEAREYAAEPGYEVALRADSPCMSGSLSLPSLK